MPRRHHRTAGLVAAVVAGSQLMTPGHAWAAGVAPTATDVSAVGTVASVRVSELVVTRAYRFRDSRPRTVKFVMNAGTTVVVNGAAGGPGAVRAGMRVSVTGALGTGGNVATRVVVANPRP